MSLEMIQSIGAIVSLIFGICASFYAAIKTEKVKALEAGIEEWKKRLQEAKADAAYWKDRHDADRDEIHTINAEHMATMSTMQANWEDDKIELAKLRASTDFGPVDAKLTVFMDAQNKERIEQARMNEALINRIDSASAAQDRQTKVFIQILEKLVPGVSREEIEQQEQPL